MSDDRTRADEELRELASEWVPNAERTFLKDAGGIGAQRTLWKDTLRTFVRNRLAMVAMVVLSTYVVLAIVVPMGGRGDQARVNNNFAQAQLSPSLKCIPPPEEALTTICRHPFGTDQYGRDTWVRAWMGARVSLSIAVGVAIMILIIGVSFGAFSGYMGGRTDNLMMRFLDSLYGLPYVPFAVIFISGFRAAYPDANPILYMVPALALTTWFTAARIVRGQVLSLKASEYVVAARSTGSNLLRIISRHVLPNTLGVIIIAAFLEIPAAILGEALLSFIGLGVPVDYPSWGTMANYGYRDFLHPRNIIIPSFLIATTVLSFIAIADGLRDALDPRSHQH